MTTTDLALAWVRDADAENTVEKGDRLEQFTYLIAVPQLCPGATNVEWLGKGLDSLGSGQDRADIAFDWLGDRYFAQCKNYAEPLGEADADRYRTAFERRRNAGYTQLLIVCSGGFTAGAAASLLEVGATMWDAETLATVDVDLDDFLARVAADRAIAIPPSKPKVPFPHNAEAIAALVASSEPRNLVYRATGSGKTVVQAGTIAALDPTIALVFVPSIELVRQLSRSYGADL